MRSEMDNGTNNDDYSKTHIFWVAVEGWWTECLVPGGPCQICLAAQAEDEGNDGGDNGK